MQMLYRLSGDSPLWQGEQGAKRLSQMNSAISNATNLQSVEDVISYSAARDIFQRMDQQGARELLEGADGKKGGVYTGTYVDAMQLLERGVSPELLKGQWSAVRGLEGNNTAAVIERFMQMYGLNYQGAAQVWSMYRNSMDSESGDWNDFFDPEKFAEKIKDIQGSKDYRSDSATIQDILNDMNLNLVNIGKIEFDETELPTLKQAAEAIIRDLNEKNRPGTLEMALSKVEQLGRAAATLLQDDLAPSRSAHFQFGLGDIVRYKNSWINPEDFGESISKKYLDVVVGVDDFANIDGHTMSIFEEFQNKFYEFGVGPFKGGINARENEKLVFCN
jgi:hypothetical protein